MCMNNGRTLEKIFNSKPEGVRSAGRPKLRSEDGVNENVKTLEVRNWKSATLDRDKLVQLLKKAKAHQGLSINNNDNDIL